MNTTTEKRLQVTLGGPSSRQKTYVGAIIVNALVRRGAQVTFQGRSDTAQGAYRTPEANLNDVVVDIRTAGAPGTPLTVADRYADGEPTDADLAEAVRSACAALNATIKAAEDAGLTVEIDVGSEVEICEVSRPL